MKKRIVVLMCAFTLMLGMALPVSAKNSPVGKKDTTETTDKSSTAPKTGEGELLIYGAAAAMLCAGAAVVSKKRLNTIE